MQITTSPQTAAAAAKHTIREKPMRRPTAPPSSRRRQLRAHFHQVCEQANRLTGRPETGK
jgi:hypothetical protein